MYVCMTYVSICSPHVFRSLWRQEENLRLPGARVEMGAMKGTQLSFSTRAAHNL